MALVSLYARELNCLRDTQKTIRLPALQRLHGDLLKQALPEAQTFFSHHLKPLLFALLADPVDKCRELAVSLLSQLSATLPDFSSDVVEVIEAVSRRLTSVPIAETVEEIRLAEVKLVKESVRKWWEVLPPAVNDIGHIVARALQDPFPQVKHEAAELLEIICKSTGLRIGLCASGICAGGIENLSHQHSKVRQTTLLALGTLFEKTGNSELLKTLYPVLKQKLRYDRTAVVRTVLYCVIRNWLLAFPFESLVFEADFEGKGTPTKLETQLTYLLVSGIGDSDQTIADRVLEHLEAAGERRKQLAREFDEQPAEEQSPILFQILHVLPDLIRLSLADCTEWTVHEHSKTRGAVVLLAITRFAGQYLTPHLETILKTVIKCYTESEDAAQRKVYEELIATMAKTCAFGNVAIVLSKNLAADQSSPSQRTSVFTFIKISADSVSSETLQPSLSLLISKLLESETLALDEHTATLLAYAGALEAVLISGGSAIQPQLDVLFRAILNLYHTEVTEVAKHMLEVLARACNVENATALFSLQLPMMLPQLILDCKGWDQHSRCRFAFQTLVVSSGEAIIDYLGTVIDVLAANCQRDKDAEVKADMLLVLDALVSDSRLHLALRPFSQRLFREVLGPVMQWKPGATGSKIRKAGLICLTNLFRQAIPEPVVVLSEWTYVFPVIQTCLEDDYDPELRFVGCLSVEQLLLLCSAELTEWHVTEVSGVVRKRLDDSKDFIRLEACTGLRHLFVTAQRIGHFSPYRDMLKVLFLHLDDPSEAMSAAVRGVLESALPIDRSEFLEVAKEVVSKQMRQSVVRELMDIANR